MGKRPHAETVGARSPRPFPDGRGNPATTSLTLQECYELALQRSETLALQQEEIKEAEAQFYTASSEALGDVHFIMTTSRLDVQKGGAEGSVGSSFTDPARQERKFTINQPLFQGFKALGALAGAGSLKREQKEEWIRARQLLFSDVAQAFYGLLRERKNLEILDGIHALFEERIKELGEREKIGRSRPSEIATATARMKIIEADRARMKGSAALAEYLLEFLTGTSLESRELLEGELPEENFDTLTMSAEMIENRPDVEAAKQSLKTAKQGVIVAQSGLWPVLSIEHNQYERREGFQGNIDWDFLFKVDVPLFQGGETVGEIKKAVSQWKQEKLSYSLKKREAELDIKNRYENWRSSAEESKALEEAVKAAQENFRLQEEEYEHSLVNNLDVLEALETLFETSREANQAYYQMKIDYWNLQIALGEEPLP